MSRGQSLVEVLVGIAIGAIFIVGAAMIIAPSLQIGKQTTQVQVKTELATELGDNIRAWAAGNWNNVLVLATGTANDYHLNATTSPFAVAVTRAGSTTTSTATIALVQSTSTGEYSATTENWTMGAPPLAGDTIVVWVTDASGGFSVSDNGGNTYHSATGEINNSGCGQVQKIFYANNVAATSSPLTLTVSNAAGSFDTDVILEYSGIATSSVLDATSTMPTQNVANGSTSAMTLSGSSDLAFSGYVGCAGSAGTAGANYTLEYHDNSIQFAVEDWSTAAGTVKGVWTNSKNNVALTAAAFKAGIITNITPTTYATGTEVINETINSGLEMFGRYFYLSDVYRDVNGNVTTTASGNNYDPSTKLVTVVVSASTTPATPTTTMSFYLTRNESTNFSQTSWGGSSGVAGPLTVAGTGFMGSSDITVTATGSIQITSGGGGCAL